MSLSWPKTAVFPPQIAALMAGRIFCGGYLWTSIADAASVTIHVSAGANRALINAIITCAGQAKIQPSVGNTYTSVGTEQTMHNRMPSSGNVPTTKVYITPTINVAGVNCTPVLVEGGSAGGVGGVRTGAEASDDYGALLVNGDDILYTITNTSGAAMSIGAEIFASELQE